MEKKINESTTSSSDGVFKGKLDENGEEIDLYNYNGHAITFALINAIKELKANFDQLKNNNT